MTTEKDVQRATCITCGSPLIINIRDRDAGTHQLCTKGHDYRIFTITKKEAEVARKRYDK